MKNDFVVTIDGPVGSGKSTVGRLLADQLQMLYLDTGAMYRVVALESRAQGVDPQDDRALESLCAGVKISFEKAAGGQRVLSGGRDVSAEIRTPDISMLASRVSAMPSVRKALVSLQRDVGKTGGVVADGRDAGTVIFPQARFKFYLEASAEVRAQRRYEELIEKGLKVFYNDIFNELRKRDADDSSRALSPLKPAEDAVILDTSEMTIEDVLGRMDEIIQQGKSSLP